MKKKITIYTIIILLIILVIVYLNYENSTLEINYYNINNNKISDSFNGFKIVQISDYHNEPNNKLNKDLIKKIEHEKPDIIILTGDLIDSNKENINQALTFIKNIKTIAPIYYITGNHEAYIDDYDNLRKQLIENNVEILDNKLEVLEINGDKINLIGVNDPMMSNETFIEDKYIMENYLENIEYDKSLYTILLSHRPELIETYKNFNIDLVFSGHAHGGQIRLFGQGLVAPNQKIFPKYTKGEYNINNTKMIVSAGIGNSVLPFRINNNPELIVVTLN